MSHTIDVNRPLAGVATVTFTDKARQNQLCWAAVDELAWVLADCREDGCRVIVLASGLAGHWLEHAWLRDLHNGVEGREQTGTGVGWFKAQQALTHDDVISIAAISGDSSGGGAELGWACDLRIAEAQARFSQPEINMGLTTGIGGCSRLARLAGTAAAAEMVYTGRAVPADRLYQLGAITRVVDEGKSLDMALELAESLAEKSHEALRGLKRILNEGAHMPLSSALELEQSVFQSVVVSDEARCEMARIQAAYDAGQSVAEVNEYARWDDNPKE